jgi:hypothetical protein
MSADVINGIHFQSNGDIFITSNARNFVYNLKLRCVHSAISSVRFNTLTQLGAVNNAKRKKLFFVLRVVCGSTLQNNTW